MSDLTCEQNEEHTNQIDGALLKKIKDNPKLQELINVLDNADDEGLNTLINLAKMIDRGKPKD